MLLKDLYNSIITPGFGENNEVLYSVLSVPERSEYFVGKNSLSQASFILHTTRDTNKILQPIHLKTLDVQFDIPCNFIKADALKKEEKFTIISCKSDDEDTITYFLSICYNILCLLGDQPKQEEIVKAIEQIVSIFEKLRYPSIRSLNGLFGELYIILNSKNPMKSVEAWRTDSKSRFDFTFEELRIEVKTTSGRVRNHNFSYDQCNPPSDTKTLVASLFVEQVSNGITLKSTIEQISDLIYSDSDLLYKLHSTVAATLGSTLNEALKVSFDPYLTDSSLMFFDVNEIPAIRNPLPKGVTNMHFNSDLSECNSISIEHLVETNPVFAEILPSPY